jgi:hypothetical protein
MAREIKRVVLGCVHFVFRVRALALGGSGGWAIGEVSWWLHGFFLVVSTDPSPTFPRRRLPKMLENC